MHRALRRLSTSFESYAWLGTSLLPECHLTRFRGSHTLQARPDAKFSSPLSLPITLTTAMASEPSTKRVKLGGDILAGPALIRRQRAAFLSSISRNISPPASSRRSVDIAQPLSESFGLKVGVSKHAECQTSSVEDAIDLTSSRESTPSERLTVNDKKPKPLLQLHHHAAATRYVQASPFRLMKIRDLPTKYNQDTVSLHDILGNPLIREVWIFNFCFDIDWLMQHFDPDTRDLVAVKIVHGSWRQEDTNRILIEEAVGRWKNIEAFKAYLPDQFGTHHSKIFVLFTHDDKAEVIIHTANMLAKDWTNMTQAVWRTGPLPKMKKPNQNDIGVLGSSRRFKHDLLQYLKAYKKPTQALVKQLQGHDFSSVRGALIASIPSRMDQNQKSSTIDESLYGYPRLREVISHIQRTATVPPKPSTSHHLVAQVSSIATLPTGWLDNLFACTVPSAVPAKPSAKTLSILYPTPTNVATSLDGYSAGGSIHTKAQTPAHLTQISNLRPYLHQWTTNDSEHHSSGRATAAPHIKTYTSFTTKPTQSKLDKNEIEINWALLTSANLSTQAWGSLPRKSGGDKGLVVVGSFEIGVCVWPELYADDFDDEANEGEAGGGGGKQKDREGEGLDRTKRRARMVPCFGKDMPDTEAGNVGAEGEEVLTVGLRMPYDLPLTPYAQGELPWSPGSSYDVPDSKGRKWPPTDW